MLKHVLSHAVRYGELFEGVDVGCRLRIGGTYMVVAFRVDNLWTTSLKMSIIAMRLYWFYNPDDDAFMCLTVGSSNKGKQSYARWLDHLFALWAIYLGYFSPSIYSR